MAASPDLTTPSAVNSAVKTIADTIRRSNCAGAIQYVPEPTRMLFLRILDVREAVAVNPDRKEEVDPRTSAEIRRLWARSRRGTSS